MKKGVAITLAVVLVVVLGVIIFITIKRSAPSQSPISTTLEECQTIYYNGESGVNVVIMSDAKTAKTYADNLLSLPPFSDSKDAFNFYAITDYTPQCELYKGIALLCYSPELIKKAASCPSDYIIVIKEEEAKIRSSAYMNVISLNSKLQKTVLAHEFGHAFANLADEYTPSQIPKGSENCAKDCESFGGGCFKGCSTDDYYRSIEAGLMRTLSVSTFGKFNEELISKRISTQSAQTITASAIAEPVNCENEMYYLIEGNYTSSNMTVLSKSIEQGCLGSNGIGPFNYTIILNDNSRQFQGEFNAELIFTDTQAEEESINGETQGKEGIFLLKIPVVENAKSLELSTETMKVEVSLGERGARPCEITQ